MCASESARERAGSPCSGGRFFPLSLNRSAPSPTRQLLGSPHPWRGHFWSGFKRCPWVIAATLECPAAPRGGPHAFISVFSSAFRSVPAARNGRLTLQAGELLARAEVIWDPLCCPQCSRHFLAWRCGCLPLLSFSLQLLFPGHISRVPVT